MSDKPIAAGAPAGHTAALARFATDLRFGDIPPPVVNDMKRIVLDGLGCALFGSALAWPKILTDFVRENEGPGPVTIWGTKVRTSSTSATMVNGTSVHSFEIDDVHPGGGRQHAASVAIPPVLALAEQYGPISGEEALSAMIAGLEVGNRIGLSLGVNSASIGWHAPSVCGVFPAVVAAGRCLKLSEGWMDQAIGLAATQAAGLHASHKSGAMAKRWHAGKAAQSGLYAALLASRGFTGPEGVLERDVGGFCNTFTQGRSQVDFSRLTQGLGKTWETSRTQLKIYSCRGMMHSALDGIRELRRKGPLDAADVEQVTVWIGQNLGSSSVPYEPGSMSKAQMNMGYCVAVMLLEGACFVGQFDEAKLADPKIVDLARRVRSIHDPAIDAMGSAHQHHMRMEVKMRDGRTLHVEVEQAAGGAEIPIPQDELVGKFRSLAGTAFPPSRLDGIIDRIDRFETLADVAEVSRSLAV